MNDDIRSAARRVVAAWAGLRPTRPSWIEDVNAAVLALGEALKAEPAGCETEADCDSQPWCRISGECHRKQKQPEPAQGPVWVKGELPPRYIARSPIQAEPAQEPITRIFGTLPVHDAQQPEPVGPVAWWMPQHLRHQGKSFTSWVKDGHEKPPIYFGWVPLGPIRAQRRALTDEEIDRLWHDNGAGIDAERFARIARAIERKVRGEKE